MTANEQLQNSERQMTLTADSFSSLVRREFKPRSDQANYALNISMQTLAEHALSAVHLIADDTLSTIEALIAAIDSKLSSQVNAILHHKEFRQLESSWRGLHYLVSNSETDEKLKIKFLNISKAEMARELKKF